MTTSPQSNPPDYLSKLLELGQLINSSLDLRNVLDTAIDQVIEFIGAERGFIILVETETGRVWGEAVRNIEKSALEATLGGKLVENGAEISRSIVEAVLDTRRPVVSHNAMEDPRFSSRSSVQLTNLRSVACVPLVTQGRLLGVVYLDNRVRSGAFTERHLAMLQAFANQTAAAFENARLYDVLRRSVDERLRLQEELHAQERDRMLLEEASRLKSDFVGYVAHELRNPLTSIRGYVQTLMNSEPGSFDPATAYEFYEIIEAESDRLLNLINELLDVSRLDSGRPLGLAPKDVEIRSLIQKLVRRFRLDKFATARRRIVANVDDDVPVVLFADEDKLNQILSNLIGNAIKYSPKGGDIVIAVHREPPDRIRIDVSDQGVGMSAEQVARLGGKYERLERDEIKGIPGTGLGLYLAKSLAQLHGGSIECESQPGRGSTFTLRLPERVEA